jgi:hypothetical protein
MILIHLIAQLVNADGARFVTLTTQVRIQAGLFFYLLINTSHVTYIYYKNAQRSGRAPLVGGHGGSKLPPAACGGGGGEGRHAALPPQ